MSGIEALITKLSANEVSVRCDAVIKLSRIGEPAVPALIEALKTSNEMTREWIIDSLWRIGAPAVPHLTAVLREGDENICQSITMVLDWIRETTLGLNRAQSDETKPGQLELFDYHADETQNSSQPSEETALPLTCTESAVSFWREKGLNVRAANCLAKANILNEEQIVERLTSFDDALALKNCGRLTAKEIWTFITNLKTASPLPKDPSSDEASQKGRMEIQLREGPQDQSVSVPLLNTKVSLQTWERLQSMPIHQFSWSVRTQNGIDRQGCQTLADVAKIPPAEWLKLRNFRRQSLTEIQDKITEVVYHLDLFEKSDNFAEATTPQIQSLSELGHTILERLREREQEVVRLCYGYADEPQNLQQVGDAIGITRERVRQIKEAVNAKINQGAEYHLITKAIPTLLSNQIANYLSGVGGFCRVEALRQQLGWGDAERWLINWFDEAFGEAWICFGTDDYEVIDGVCYLKSEGRDQGGFADIVTNLRRYGYRPLTWEACIQLYQKTNDLSPDQKQFWEAIASHPEFKVYQYGLTYIGLKEWIWFNPEKPTTIKGQADLVEWFLRMTNKPATAKTIADGIWAELGNFRLTPVDVADACEKQPYRFQVDENNNYSLSLWGEASKYREALADLLAEEPLPIEQIIDHFLSQRPDETVLIVTALNHYHETFVEIAPFEWALKSHDSQDTGEDDFNYEDLTFEDLIPK